MKPDDLKKILAKPGIAARNPGVAQAFGAVAPKGKTLCEVFAGEAKPAKAVTQDSYEEERMNKLESAFWDYLKLIRPVCKPKAVTLRLASKVRYTPDFDSSGPKGEVQLCEAN